MSRFLKPRPEQGAAARRGGLSLVQRGLGFRVEGLGFRVLGKVRIFFYLGVGVEDVEFRL